NLASFNHAQIINQALVRWVSGRIELTNQSSIQNYGQFRIESGNGLIMTDPTHNSAFNNFNFLVKTQGAGMDIIDPTLNNLPNPNNPITPSVEVDAGSIQYEGDGGTNTANFLIAPNCEFKFAGATKTNTFQGASNFSGGGTVIVSGLTDWN